MSVSDSLNVCDLFHRVKAVSRYASTVQLYVYNSHELTKPAHFFPGKTDLMTFSVWVLTNCRISHSVWIVCYEQSTLTSCSLECTIMLFVVGPGVRSCLSQGPHTDNTRSGRNGRCYDLHDSVGQVRSQTGFSLQ